MSGSEGVSAAEAAKAKQLVVIEPGPRELFVDIDNEEDMERCRQAVIFLGKHVVSKKQSPSSSGRRGRYHVTITLDHDLGNIERICLQAIVGSDWRRELLSYKAHRRGVATPSVFFERPKP